LSISYSAGFGTSLDLVNEEIEIKKAVDSAAFTVKSAEKALLIFSTPFNAFHPMSL
jgi:hypothetical protein